MQGVPSIWNCPRVSSFMRKYFHKCNSNIAEETFGSVSFESIFLHLEIISNGRPIKVPNDRIDISKSKSLSELKISPDIF